LKAADLFDSLNEEREQEKKEFKVERSPVLDALVEGFTKALHAVRKPAGFQEKYAAAETHAPTEYTAKDIETFSIIARKQFPDGRDVLDHLGLYISALINSCEAEHFIIHTRHLADPYSLLGYKNNGRRIHIAGDVSYNVGQYQTSGEIYVAGNASDCASIGMEGGSLHVCGNAARSVGNMLRGGTVRIDGNTGPDVGDGMLGGTIHVMGSLGIVAGTSLSGGDIYHKGKLVVKDGVRVDES